MDPSTASPGKISQRQLGFTRAKRESGIGLARRFRATGANTIFTLNASGFNRPRLDADAGLRASRGSSFWDERVSCRDHRAMRWHRAWSACWSNCSR